jgi:putative ABC transport system permease protein
MASEHLRSSSGRIALTVVAVALGVALVVAIQLMNEAVLTSFLDTIDALTGRAAFTITLGEDLTFPEAVVDSVSSVPGVKLAVPLVRAVAFPDDGSGELLTVHGVDITHDAAVRVYHQTKSDDHIVDDPLVFVSQPDSIILGREFADRRGLHVDDKLNLVTPHGTRTFTIRGLVDPQGVARTLSGRLVVMDLLAAEQAFTTPGEINQIDVLLAPGTYSTDVQQRIQAAVPNGLIVEEPTLRKNVLRKTIGGFQAMLTSFGFLAVLAGFFICYSRLGAVFEERTWEVGLMRSVGLTRSGVMFELLKEALLLGCSGTILGVPLGLLAARYGLPLVAKAAALNFRSDDIGATTSLSPRILLLGGLVGTTAPLLAAVIPALRVARRPPIAALTMRGREFPASNPKLARILSLSLGSLVIALLTVELACDISWLGHLITVLVVILVGVSASPLLAAIAEYFVMLWSRLFGPIGEHAAASIVRNRRRTAVTIATLGIGLGTVLMFSILSSSFEQSVVSQMTTRLRANIVVNSMFTSGGWISAPISDQIIPEIQTLPRGIIAAGVQLKAIAYRDTPVSLYAYDFPCLLDKTFCDWSLRNDAAPAAMADVATGRAAIVSPSFSRAFGVAVGDTIGLTAPSGTQPFIVAAITLTAPDMSVFISRDRLRQDWQDSQVTWIYANVAPGRSIPAEIANLEKILGERYRVQVRPVSDLIDFLRQQVHNAFQAIYLVGGFTLLLLLIAVGDLFATNVLDRRRELAAMRSIGLAKDDLFKLIVHEGAAIGTLGVVLGLALGVSLGFFWVEIQFPRTLGWSLTPHLPIGLVASVCAMTVSACIAGSLLPAVHATRVSIALALRCE